MFGSSLGASALLTVLSAFLASTVQALPRISRTGRYLYDPSGNRFYIKGIAYQEQGAVVASSDNPFGEPSSFIDPLALPTRCARDVRYLTNLGVNTIRVYSVNSSLDHDSCMSAFNAAGIYTIIDLALPLNGSIDRLSPTWTTNVLNQYIRTIDVFSKYENVLGYNIGNEVVTGDHIDPAPFVKAAARDIRAYLNSKGSSALVGYAAIDGASDFRTTLANYLTCSDNNSNTTSIDMYGLNVYSWCGNSTFQASYATITSDFANYNVVAYFGEFGCNTVTPRVWSEVTAMYSTDMNTVWSGGIAFSYFPAQSAAGEFGIVTVSGDTVTTGTEYDNLRTQYTGVTTLNTPPASSAPASSYPTCPASIGGIPISSTLPPTPNDPACTCLKSTLSCQFTPATSNYSSIVGGLINTGCSMLGQVSLTCADIGGNGSTGVYGRISSCDPTVKASYVMSLYYEANSKNEQACSFNHNGTAKPTASSVSSVASSCISNPGSVFTPSPASSTTPGKTSSTTTSKSSKAAAVSLLERPHGLVGLTMTAVVALLGGLWTLA